MELDIFGNGKDYISASRASKKVGYASNYIGQLCRSGKISGKLVGRTWYVDLEDLKNHKRNTRVGKVKKSASEALTPHINSKISSWDEGNSIVKDLPRSFKNVVITYENDFGPRLPELIKFDQKTASITTTKLFHQIVGAALSLTLAISGGLWTLRVTSPEIATTLESRAFSSADFGFGELAAVSLFDSLSNSVESFIDGFRSLRNLAFGVSPDNAGGPIIAREISPAAYLSGETTRKVGSQPTLGSIAQAVTATFDKDALKNELRTELEQYFKAQYALGNVPEAIFANARVIRPDILVTDTIPAVTRQSTSDVENISKSISNLTNGSLFTLLNFTSATGTSMELQNLVLTGSTTLQNFSFQNGVGENATTTNFFSTTASTTNFFSNLSSVGFGTFTSILANGSTTLQNFSAQNGVLANLLVNGSTTLQNFTSQNSTTTNATSTNLSITGDGSGLLFTGTGNHDIYATGGTLRIATSTIYGNLSAVDNSVNIGSSGTRFGTIYADTVNASSIVGTLSTGNFTSDTVTINSDNATADTESSYIAFERGSITPNALITWDSANDRFSLNAPLAITGGIGNGDLLVTGSTTLQTVGMTYASTTQIQSTSNAYFATADGNVGIGTTNPGQKLEVNGTIYANGSFSDTPLANTSFLSPGGWWGVRMDSTSRFNIDVYNNNSPLAAFTINQSGNVGIGTTNPSTKLEVSGGLLATGSTTLQNFTFTNATGTAATTTDLYVSNLASTTQIRSNYGTIGGLTALASGNVGVGTTNPTYRLTVTGGADSGQLWVGTDASFGYLIGRNTTNGDLDIKGSQGLYTGYNFKDASGNSQFYVAADSVNNNTGFIGISTRVPTSKIHAIQSGNVNNKITLDLFASNQTLSSGLLFRRSSQHVDSTSLSGTQNGDLLGTFEFQGVNLLSSAYATSSAIRVTQDGTAGNTYVPGKISFLTSDGTNDIAERLTIKPAGNVGIATSTPSYKLSVSGSGFFDGGTVYASSLVATSTITTAYASTTQIQSTSNAYFATSGGGVGIGTTTPTAKLSLSGSLYVEGSPDISFTTVGSESSMLTLNRIKASFTGASDTTRRSGLVVENEINPSSGTLSINNASEMTAYVPSTYTTAATIGTIRTGSFYVTNDSTSSTAGIITPLFTTATARGEGTLTRVSGAETSAVVESTQTVTTAQSLLSSVTHTGSGVITNAYGLRVSSIGNSGGGTITNTYGVHVGDITAGTQTNTPYSFYASDTGAYNYFAGNVGIGTTNPSTKLEVSGGLLATGSTTLQNFTFTNATGTAATTTDLYVSNLASTTQIRSNYGSIGGLTALASGNVGIGTASPSEAKLQLYTTTTNSTTVVGQYITNPGSGANTGTAIRMGYGAATTNTSGISGYYDGSQMALGLLAGTNQGMTILASGNVGIGTTNPGETLSVTGTSQLGSLSSGRTDMTRIAGYGILHIDAARYGSFGHLLFNANANYSSGARKWLVTNALSGTSFGIVRSTDSTTDPTLTTAGAISSGTADFVINNTGNVGIGTTNPSQSKLQILGAGTTNSTESLVVEDSGGTDTFAVGDGGTLAFGKNFTITANSFYAAMTANADLSSNAITYTNNFDDLTAGVHGLNLQIKFAGTQSYGNSRGINAIVESTTTDTGSVLTAINGSARLGSASGRATTLIGGGFDAQSDAATGGTITNLIGVKSLLEVENASVTATNAYGFKLDDIVNTGTITNTYGVHIGDVTTGTQTNTAYSIYASDASAYSYFAGNVGIAMTNPSVALDITGSIEYTGDITDVSDERLKQNITEFTGGLSILKNIGVKNYQMISSPGKQETGFIAQNVQQYFPQAVSVIDPDNGYLGVSYVSFIPVLAKGIQELDAKIEALSISSATSSALTITDDIFGQIWTRVVAKLADVANGIGDFFAERVRTKELCVRDDGGELCITKADLEQLLANARMSYTVGQNPGGNSSGGSGDAGGDTGTTTPETGGEGDTGTTTVETTGGDSGTTTPETVGGEDEGGTATSTNP